MFIVVLSHKTLYRMDGLSKRYVKLYDGTFIISWPGYILPNLIKVYHCVAIRYGTVCSNTYFLREICNDCNTLFTRYVVIYAYNLVGRDIWRIFASVVELFKYRQTSNIRRALVGN